ncbi:MAG: preprotein translocase subunit SecA [Parcubacteria group bacterium]
MGILTKLFGDPNQKVIDDMQPLVDKINGFSSDYEKLSAEELKNKTVEFKKRLANGKTLDDILPEAFATIREANRRAIKVRHFDVQLIGGIVLHRGEIAEMKTGEGKTHVAGLTLYLNSLEEKGAHLVTVNDYLARRDAGWNGPANHLLGISTACIAHESSYIYDPEYIDEQQSDFRLKNLRPCSRQQAYAADITYGTNSEFGFDYLRDNMVYSLAQMTQRDLHYAIVDEVDSILIDEARTPLIISAPNEDSGIMYQRLSGICSVLKEKDPSTGSTSSPQASSGQGDYSVDEKMRTAIFTDEGLRKVEKALNIDNLAANQQLYYFATNALKAKALFERDKHYVVKDGEVVIIDEFTGRLMHGRRYSEGLHQAIEAKEGVEVQQESRTLATITIQNYFRMYKKLSGMTGTAATEAEEFSKIYNLEVTAIPTNRPTVRQDLSDRIYSSEKGKFLAVVQEIKRLHEKGQPVLVGTISIEKNELLSLYLKQAGVPHALLNAKQHEKEAEILAQAGRVGGVTVATNMAGRGVDIILGGSPFNQEEHEKVKERGGLFVLGTERHEARRIDNQLRGRAGRQGDPGASQFYISMEDDLMRVFGSDRVKNMMQRLGVPEDQPIENKFVSRSIETAQKRVEGNNFDIRKHLVEFDDVINKQREIIYKRRREILNSAKGNLIHSKEMMLEMIEDEIQQIVSFHTAGDDQAAWNLKEICDLCKAMFPMSDSDCEKISSIEKLAGDRLQDASARTEIIEYLFNISKTKYEELEAGILEKNPDKNFMRLIEREILIRSIDNLWIGHLEEIASLREGIGLRGYAQRDPLIEYKRETYQMFLELLNLIQRQAVYSIYKIGFTTRMAPAETENIKTIELGPTETAQFKDPYAGAGHQDNQNSASQKTKNAAGEKVGRNDPCPCGSGKKYKKCCGE